MKLTPQARFQIAVLPCGPGEADALGGLDRLDWLSCRRCGPSAFEFLSGDRLLSSIDLEHARFDLDCLIGIVCIADENEFDEIEGQWTSVLPSIGLVFKRVATWDAAAVVRAAIECLAEALAEQRAHSGRAALELATYRREYDRLQYNFTRLEGYVAKQSLRTANEIFEYPPEMESSASGADPALSENHDGTLVHRLVQGLPVDSLGVSSICFYAMSKPATEGETLHLRLGAIETGQVFGEWALQPADVETGWVELALNSALDESALSLEIIAEWPEGSEWILALGPPHPIPMFCARSGDGRRFGAPLAIRIFTSLPGVRVSATSTAIRPVDALSTFSEFLPSELYADVTQVIPSSPEDGVLLVSYDREVGCIAVHPRKGGLTVGRINVAVPRNAWGISARIHLANERSSPTDFALLVCSAHEGSRELARVQQSDSPFPSFSGWKTLAPLEVRRLCVVLAASHEKELAILLVTRQAPDVSPDFAWARFSDLEFNVLSKSWLGRAGAESTLEVVADVS